MAAASVREGGQAVEARVLGLISVRGSNGKGICGVKKATALFGLLVTSPQYRCTTDEIAEHLWPGQECPRERVYKVASLLRGVLGDEVLPDLRSSVCVMNLPEGSVDLLRFREGVRKAAHLKWPEKFAQLCTALAEWQDDEPLRGLPEETFGGRRAELREELMAAVCDRMEAALRAGEDTWLRMETKKWYERMPERSRIFGFYLIAHGQAMARGVLERLIDKWEAAHGKTEQDPELQEIVDELRSTPRRSRGTSLRRVPDQLPAGKHRPFGRAGLIDELAGVARTRQEAERPTLIVLSGMAGVGKSLVAYRLGAVLRERFPDGALYANLRGFAGAEVRPAEPEHVLDGFLAEFPPYSGAAGIEAKSAALRSVLADKSVLIVLDDAVDVAQVRPLLPGNGTSAVIVTSRNTLRGLGAGQDPYFRKVDLLDDESAAAILREKLPKGDPRGREPLIRALVELCGRHPLALTVIARRLENRSVRGTSDLVRDLREEKEKLGVLHLPEEELSVRMALACSIRALSPAARRLLRRLAVHPGPSAGWDAVMDLGPAGDALRPDHALEELVAASLVELRADRYSLHDLVRAFARHEVDPEADGVPEDFEDATVRRVLDHQLHNVHACDRRLHEQRALPVGDPAGVRVFEPVDLEQALAVLDDEYDTVQLGIQLAHRKGLERYVWLLPMALVTYQWSRRRLDDALRGLTLAREVAEKVAEPAQCAMVHRMLAGTYWRQEQFERAAGHLFRAVRLSKEDDTETGRLSLAHSLHTLALTLRKQGDGTAAEEHHRQALELYRALGDRSGEAAALNGIGTLHRDRGEYDEGLRACGEALRIAEGTTDRRCGADALYTLAQIHLSRSEGEEALRLLRRACGILCDLEHWHDEAKLLWLCADVLVAAGRSPEAVEALERVLVLRELMGGHDTQEVRDRLEELR